MQGGRGLGGMMNTPTSYIDPLEKGVDLVKKVVAISKRKINLLKDRDLKQCSKSTAIF